MGISLRTITDSDLELIMKWRMSESVTKYMNTNPHLTMDGQKQWLNAIKKNDNVRYWMIEVDATPAGIINLADINWEQGNASWGYYVGEEKLRSLKLAISLEMSLYDFCFDVLGLNEVHNEAFKVNEGVWKLHVACGCKVVKEVASEVEKEGVFYDVVHLSIEKDEWLELRKKKKYDKLDFDVLPELKVHHIGIASTDLENSIREYLRLGWKWNGISVDDVERNVKLAFLESENSTEMLELVCPLNEKSPVSNTLKTMKNVATPYHICYEVDNIEKAIQVFKRKRYIVTAPPSPAVAFDNRRVAFLLHRDLGLIELLEEKEYDT